MKLRGLLTFLLFVCSAAAGQALFQIPQLRLIQGVNVGTPPPEVRLSPLEKGFAGEGALSNSIAAPLVRCTFSDKSADCGVMIHQGDLKETQPEAIR